jgi:hypothetical protein
VTSVKSVIRYLHYFSRPRVRTHDVYESLERRENWFRNNRNRKITDFTDLTDRRLAEVFGKPLISLACIAKTLHQGAVKKRQMSLIALELFGFVS